MLWLGKPGGRLESAHRLKKLMVGATRWLQALTVLGDVRRDPEIRGILSPNCAVSTINFCLLWFIGFIFFGADGEIVWCGEGCKQLWCCRVMCPLVGTWSNGKNHGVCEKRRADETSS